MTRDLAIKATQALNEIEGFEVFMERIEGVIDDSSDYCYLEDFRDSLMKFLEVELERRKSVLENL